MKLLPTETIGESNETDLQFAGISRRRNKSL